MYKLSTAAHHPHDALTAASAALATLSFLIGTRNELSLEASECFGLSVMLDAIHDDMNKVAEVIESDRRQYEADGHRQRQTSAAEYERGYQNGHADGLLHSARLPTGEGEQGVAHAIYQGTYADGAKLGWIMGWQRAHGKPTRFDPEWREGDVAMLMENVPGQKREDDMADAQAAERHREARQNFIDQTRSAASGEDAPVPKLTEEGEQGSGASKSA